MKAYKSSEDEREVVLRQSSNRIVEDTTPRKMKFNRDFYDQMKIVSPDAPQVPRTDIAYEFHD